MVDSQYDLGKESAAEYLGISVRKLETLITQKLITRKLVPGLRGKVAMFERAELDRVKHEVLAPAAEIIKPAQALETLHNPATGLQTIAGIEQVEAIARIIKAVTPPRLDRALTIPQAAARSGLSVGFLNRITRPQRHDDVELPPELTAHKIPGLRGRRIFMSDLSDYMERLKSLQSSLQSSGK